MTATAKGFYTNKAREETQKREYEALMAALRALYGIHQPAQPTEQGA